MYSIVKTALNHHQSFIRYCIVGVFNTLVDFSVFIALFYHVGLPLLVAHGAAFLVAASVAYILHKKWTFKDKEAVSAGQFMKFLTVVFIGLLLSSIAVYVASLSMAAWIAKILAIGVSLTWNYTATRFLVFKKAD